MSRIKNEIREAVLAKLDIKDEVGEAVRAKLEAPEGEKSPKKTTKVDVVKKGKGKK